MYPSCDPWGRRFDSAYMPSRAKLAGQAISGTFHWILDGFQGDGDWVAKTFQLTRSLASKLLKILKSMSARSNWPRFVSSPTSLLHVFSHHTRSN